ncbi:MAG: helix-turn-helix transcriptional regulator [Anaerolineales bacterium]
MKEFGEELRKLRQRCNAPESPHGKLTQEKFGELVGRELGIGYSGAAVSDWERGVSKIHADQRQVVISILKVLQQWGGVMTLTDANQLLKAGNYRALDNDELQKIFGEIAEEIKVEPSTPKQNTLRSFFPFLLENLFLISENEYRELIAKVEEGPRPTWPRLLTSFMRQASEHWSLSLSDINWIWVWLLARWLITPSLRWPLRTGRVA